MVKNGRDLLGLRTLESAIPKKLIDGMSWLLHAGPNLGKLKVILIVIGRALSKMDNFIDHETLKSDESHKWFDKHID